MSQPLDRTCRMQPLGDIDVEGGEFWAHPFEMAHNGDNLSAYERNRLFLNVDGRRFIDGSFASGADIDSDSRSVMVGDFNGDATPDLLVASVGGGPLRLFLNQTGSAGRLALQLVGTTSNRAGVGARVTLEFGDRRITRDVFAANGFMGHSPPRLYLGTDGHPVADRLIVEWPGGDVQEFTDLPTGGVVTIVEGSARAMSIGSVPTAGSRGS